MHSFLLLSRVKKPKHPHTSEVLWPLFVLAVWALGRVCWGVFFSNATTRVLMNIFYCCFFLLSPSHFKHTGAYSYCNMSWCQMLLLCSVLRASIKPSMALFQPHDWFSIIVTIGLLCCPSKHGWKEVPLTLPYISIKDNYLYYSMCYNIIWYLQCCVVGSPHSEQSLQSMCSISVLHCALCLQVSY